MPTIEQIRTDRETLWENMRKWYKGLTKSEQFMVDKTSSILMQRMMEGTGQGISSSDLSCKTLETYEGLQRNKDVSVVDYCLDRVNNE
jgi:hypothetical protein